MRKSQKHSAVLYQKKFAKFIFKAAHIYESILWYVLKVDMTAFGKKKMRKSVLVMYVIV